MSQKSHNFIDTPDDWCDCHCAPEDTNHFLFYCTLYSIPRHDLRTSVLNILVSNNLEHLSEDIDLYLYGHDSLQLAENKTILLSTISYISIRI